MKKVILILALGCLCFAGFAETGLWIRTNRWPDDVKLGWDPSPDPAVIGVWVYWGGVSGNYTNRVRNTVPTEATVTNLMIGRTYYFAATAFTAEGLESDFSNEIFYKIPGIVAPHLKSVVVTNVFAVIQGEGEPDTFYALERSENLKTWEQWVVLPSDKEGKFSYWEMPIGGGPVYFRSRWFPSL